MDVSGVVAVFTGLMTAALALGGASIGLSLVVAGLCTQWAWLDLHIGGFIKKVFMSVLLGGIMMGGGGAFGLWLASTLKVG